MNQLDAHYDAVVIGSGFGGSINALRLAEVGKSVVVLERGKRYPPESFPRDVTDIKTLFWRYPKKKDFQGLYELHMFSDIGVITASGVGGGSLVYANIHIRPDPVVFEDPRWPRSINRDSLDPYYDKVADTLGIAPVPPEIKMPKRDAYRDAAAKIGHNVFDPDQAVSWTEDPAEPGRKACKFIAECEFGCPIGAKNTLDFTYLARAERLGAQVQTGIYVTHIAPDEKGYRVHYQTVDGGEAGSITGTRVVLSAGTLGTNKILFQSRDVYRTLPQLSDKLGYGFSGNGDFLGSIQNSTIDLEPWNGPDVTSVIKYFEEAPRFTMAAATYNKPSMEVLASLGQGNRSLPRFLHRWLWRKLDVIIYWAMKKGLLSQPLKHPGPNAGDPARMTNLFAIGRDNANGHLRLKGKNLDITWDFHRENKALIDKMEAAMKEVGDIFGGTTASLASWPLFERILTVHPLGGCPLSESPQTGVVSTHGEVHRYPGLYVADGAVIPSSIGFHPVMTISAVSERIAEAVVNSYAKGPTLSAGVEM